MRRLDRIESESDLRSLVQGDVLHRVSLYLPVDRAQAGLEASELRARAAFERAEARLRERGVREAAIAVRRERSAAVPRPQALDHGTRTLAVFGDQAGWAWAERPEPIGAAVRVGPHYALRPLLRAFGNDQRFRVLAVSANRVATFEGDARSLRREVVDGLPGSLEDALGSEIEGGRLSHRSEQPVPGERAPGAIFHGHGGANAGRALDRERFHRALAGPLQRAWGASLIPIVLAAEVRTASELRSATDLPALLDEEIRGNPDETKPETLHAAALAAVRRERARRAPRRLAAAFERARSAGKALDGGDGRIEPLAEAALAGRVRRLWAEEEAHVPGRIDPVTGRRCAACDPSEDALDALVALVLRQAGEVHVTEKGDTPTGGPFCAELR